MTPGRGAPDGREWLETNGLGGYSMSTATGENTRRYHG
ncbi:MAG TPA: glycogen debranching enzyme N-terminal domain-containing protein, partial [Thermoanaerobaculia bacterium]